MLSRKSQSLHVTGQCDNYTQFGLQLLSRKSQSLHDGSFDVKVNSEALQLLSRKSQSLHDIQVLMVSSRSDVTIAQSQIAVSPPSSTRRRNELIDGLQLLSRKSQSLHLHPHDDGMN